VFINIIDLEVKKTAFFWWNVGVFVKVFLDGALWWSWKTISPKTSPIYPPHEQ
jgi:hypothetical protein